MDNRLLRALSRAEFLALDAKLEQVRLEHGTVLSQAHVPIAHVYFPTTAIISLLLPMTSGAPVEMALVGSDGVVGVGLTSGASASAMRAVVHVSGHGYRISAARFLRALQASPRLRLLMGRYANTLLEQIVRCAACSQRHLVSERCARWLLMAHDRVGVDTFELTQELLGNALDVKRQSVSVAAAELQRAGLIRYSRGRVCVTNRAGLEAAACGCYRVIVDDETRGLSNGAAKRRPALSIRARTKKRATLSGPRA